MTGLFVCAWLILWLAPDTSLGRFLHRWMLDRPIARAARVTRGQVICTVLLLTVAGGAVWLLQQEAGPLLGLATPEIGYLFASFEVSTWLDAVTGMVLMATGVRWRNPNIGQLFNRGPRPRSRRAPTTAIPSKSAPANDDERPSFRTAV